MRMRHLVGWCWTLGWAVQGCGTNDANRRDAPATAPPAMSVPHDQSPPPSPAEFPLGWSLRDDVPYSRTGHSLLLDEQNDRLVLFGGPASDTWQLPLSGPDANVWRELQAEGTPPPTSEYRDPYSRNRSAVYDANEGRILAVYTIAGEGGYWKATRLQQLSLQDSPRWSEIPVGGDPPHAVASVAFHTSANRLYVVGDAVWAVSLNADPDWSLLGALPAEMTGAAQVHVDARNDRIIACLNGRDPLLDGMWAFSLETNTWTRLGLPSELGGASVFDDARERFVSRNHESVSLTSLETGSPVLSSRKTATEVADHAVGVVDRKRDRVLYFGGATNAVTSLELDTFESRTVTGPTRRGGAGGKLVWDPLRSRVVACSIDGTWTRGLAASEDWQPFEFRPNSRGNIQGCDQYGLAPVNDARFGVIAFAANSSALSPIELDWTAGSWTSLDVAPGPSSELRSVAAYDSSQDRLIVHGHDEIWALNLTGVPAWTKLVSEGAGPDAGWSHVGIYDPVGRRLLVHAAEPHDYLDDAWTYHDELWSLELGESVRWTKLTPAGTGPGEFHIVNGTRSAVYDPEHRRMIVLQNTDPVVRLFALELEGTPTWHEFCDPGITLFNGSGESNVIVAPDGLFFASEGGAFRFNLATPYCDR